MIFSCKWIRGSGYDCTMCHDRGTSVDGKCDLVQSPTTWTEGDCNKGFLPAIALANYLRPDFQLADCDLCAEHETALLCKVIPLPLCPAAHQTCVDCDS